MTTRCRQVAASVTRYIMIMTCIWLVDLGMRQCLLRILRVFTLKPGALFRSLVILLECQEKTAAMFGYMVLICVLLGLLHCMH